MKCELCGSTSQLKYKGLQGYQLGMKFNIYACDTCETSFSIPRADTSKIYNAIYSNGEKVPGYNRYWSYMKEVQQQENPLQFLANSEEAFWGIKKGLEALVPDKKTTKILELGSGLGYLTYALTKEGYNIEGLDISSEAVAQANKTFGDYYVCADVHKYALEKPEAYDIVILTEVIEHIEEPIAFMESIKKLLRKDGHMIVTTPNKTLIPSDIVWDTEAPPVHHWWFSENSMQYMAKTLHLETEFIDFTKYYFNHPEAYKTNKRRKRVERKPILSEQGELIDISHYATDTTPAHVLQKKAAKKRKFLKLRAALAPSTIIFGEKGKTLCAVLKKKS